MFNPVAPFRSDAYDTFETYILIASFIGVEFDLPEALPLLEREISSAFQCNKLGNAAAAIVCSGSGHRRMQDATGNATGYVL